MYAASVNNNNLLIWVAMFGNEMKVSCCNVWPISYIDYVLANPDVSFSFISNEKFFIPHCFLVPMRLIKTCLFLYGMFVCKKWNIHLILLIKHNDMVYSYYSKMVLCVQELYLHFISSFIFIRWKEFGFSVKLILICSLCNLVQNKKENLNLLFSYGFHEINL